MKKHIRRAKSLVKILTANPKQATQGNTGGLRAAGIKRVLCIDQGTHLRVRRAHSQSRLQERGFSRRRGSVDFREAAPRQTSRDFIQNRYSRGYRARRHALRETKG